MSIPEDQLQQMARWRLLPKWRQLDVFDRLLHNEYESPDLRQIRIERRLGLLFEFCQKNVPYYRQLIPISGKTAASEEAFSLLTQLPVMERSTLQASYEQLRAQRLPRGEQLSGVTVTSGSTGQPVKVLHTLNSLRFFSFLKHREYRWWGVDPMSRLAIVRGAEDLPLVDGKPLSPGMSIAMPGWPQISSFFETGPAVAMSDVTDMGEVIDCLIDFKPSMLLGMAAVLECMALSNPQKSLSIDRVLSISQQLPKPMERLIGNNLSASVYENYGCNEVGLIASRCPVSDRFHVHIEHALVEILRENGSPCDEGESGRLVVTALNNPAMPLLRYDTGDYARKVNGDCECGRTLPSFDQLFGRYRRLAHLPESTWQYWDSILKALLELDALCPQQLKQFQLQQKSEKDYILRLVLNQSLSKEGRAMLLAKWRAVSSHDDARLEIKEVAKIERKGKKVQDFISDLVP